ncbi:hypothetical protein [Deinococcus misasensis]|uniref:hypothetical protein n=1 Tax=Deinococcus misasensis TaxID=392413 RepID=UPI000555E5BA|nr:hypothetical protein [Deinococcus misasensis]
MDVISRTLDTPIDKLPPGDHKIKLKAKSAALAWVLKFLAENGGTWDFWGKVVVPAFEAQHPKVKMPKSNFIGKTFRPRKGWIAETQTFYFWITVIK